MRLTRGTRLGAVIAAFALFPHLITAQSQDNADLGFAVGEELERQSEESLDGDTSLSGQPATQAAHTESDTILVGAIRVEGATEIGQSAFAPIVEAYVGRPLGPTDLAALASDIANVARKAGFGLASAWIPPQSSANGVLRVTLDEGRVDVIEAQGAADGLVRKMLAPLANGRPMRTAELERRLLLAGDIAGVRLGKPRLDRENGRNVLRVATARDSLQAEAAVDNWGTDTVGPVRARLAVDFNGLVAADDRLTIGGVITPAEPDEFQLARASYTKPIGIDGTEMTLSGYYARSHPGAYLSGRDFDGTSLEAELGLSHPVIRSRETSLWARASLRLRDSEQTRADTLVRDDRIAALTIGGYGVHRFENGRFRARLSLVHGLDLLGATQAGDPLASRRDADGRFTKLEYWAEYQRRFGGGFSMQAQVDGQWASGPLLSSDEMGLGGRYFLRAYDYRERSGDSGAAGSLELRYDLPSAPGPFAAAQFYAYGDAGRVRNHGRGRGGGTLASAGAGARARISKIDVGVEVAVPLKDREDAENRCSPRLSFTLGRRF